MVNVGKISRLTKAGDVVLVPGKVLGGGFISHKVVIGAHSFTPSAKAKIAEAGGKALRLPTFVEKYPSGEGVTIIGG